MRAGVRSAYSGCSCGSCTSTGAFGAPPVRSLPLGLLLGSSCGALAAAFALLALFGLGLRLGERLLVGLGGRREGDVEPAYLVDRVVVDLGKDDLLAHAQRVVAAAVEGAR